MTKLSGWALALVVTFPAVVFAEGGEHERELEAARKKVRHLIHEAEALEEAGKRERAAEMRRKAEILQERIERSEKSRHKERRHKPGKKDAALKKILHGLEVNIRALEKLGRAAEAEHLMHVVKKLARELHGRHGKREKEDPERAFVRRHTEMLRMAFEAAARVGKKRWAELLEHSIHSYELALEGRRDEKAMKIRKSAPNWGNQIELLMAVTRLMDEKGWEDRAHKLGRYAKKILAQYREKQERAKKARMHREEDRAALERREKERMERREADLRELREFERRDRRNDLERAMRRIERLEKQLDRMGRLMERMQDRLEDVLEEIDDDDDEDEDDDDDDDEDEEHERDDD